MDETSKEQYKWKFYRLAVQLNVIILLAALAVLSLFLSRAVPHSCRDYPARPRPPALLYFVISYRLTKAWLDEH